MKVASKHDHEMEGVFTDFSGGLDKSRPPFLLDDRYLYDITNFYYDPTTGYPTTRPGLKKYSAAACPAGVVGVYELVRGGVSTVLVVCEDNKLYYLDAGKTPVEIGDLTGQGRPSFATLNQKAVVATGGKIQTYDGAALVTPAASPRIGYISDHVKRDAAAIIGVGDNVNRDRVHRSGVNDPENWTAATEQDYKYMDAGFKDGLEASGIVNFMHETFIFKRNPYGGQKGIYRANLADASADWYCRPVTRSRTTISPHFIIEAGDIYFVDTQGPMRLSTIPTSGDFPFLVDHFGLRIAGELANFVTTDGFSIFDPYKRIWMIKPQKNSTQFYCGDPVNDRWTYFQFVPNILCGADCLGKMLFGAADGWIYEYDSTLDKDDGTNYVKSLETKWFDYSYTLANMLKEKYLSVVGITAGTLTMTVKVKGNVKHTKPLAFGEDWWSWSVVNSITPENWLESLSKIIGSVLRDNKPVSGDQFSIQIAISSGLCAIGQLGGRIAVTGRAGKGGS